jgi:hypothetical protein
MIKSIRHVVKPSPSKIAFLISLSFSVGLLVQINNLSQQNAKLQAVLVGEEFVSVQAKPATDWTDGVYIKSLSAIAGLIYIIEFTMTRKEKNNSPIQKLVLKTEGLDLDNVPDRIILKTEMITLFTQSIMGITDPAKLKEVKDDFVQKMTKFN